MLGTILSMKYSKYSLKYTSMFILILLLSFFFVVSFTFGLLSYIIAPSYGMFEFIEQSLYMGTAELLVNISMSITVLITVIATLWSFVDYFKRFKDDIDVEN